MPAVETELLRGKGHDGLASGGCVPLLSLENHWERMGSRGEPLLWGMLDLRSEEADTISLPAREATVSPQVSPHRYQLCPQNPLRVPALSPAPFIARANVKTAIAFSTLINTLGGQREKAASRTPAAGR